MDDASTANGSGGGMSKIERAERVLDRQLEWIKSVDSKVTIIAAIDVALLAIFADRIPASPSSWGMIVLLSVIGTGGLLASLVFCALASFPQLKSRSNSIVYFKTIASHSVAQFTKRFVGLSDAEFLDDLLEQVHRNAEIANSKFQKVKGAKISFMLGAVPWIVVIVVFRIMEST